MIKTFKVSLEYHWEGEFSVDAKSDEEAREIVRDIIFSDPWDEAEGNSQALIHEVYEWEEEK